MKRTLFGRAITLLVCALLLSGLSGSPAAGQGRLDRVVIVQGQEVDGLDASMSSGVLNLNAAHHIMEPLVRRDANLKVIPWLAQSWKWEDKTTLVMTLRQGVRFHDGTAFDAADVTFTFGRIMDKATKSDHFRYFNPDVVASVSAKDRFTVVFKLTAPFGPFVGFLTLVGIASKESVERMRPEAYGRAPVGTGPYIIAEWRPGVRIRMTANKEWWGGPLQIQELEWRAIGEDSTRVAELLTGRAHIVTALPPSNLKGVLSSGNSTVKRAPSLRSVWIQFNTRKKPLSDPRVREALNLGVDMDAIIRYVLQGYARRLNTVIGPEVFGFNPNLEPVRHDVERAKRLLEEAGYGSGLQLRMTTRKGRLVKDVEVVEAIVAQLGAIGVKVSVQIVDQQRHQAVVGKYTDDVDMFLFSNANNTADAHYNLGLNFYSKSRAIYWSVPQVDRLVEAAAKEVDVARRERLYHQIQEVIRRDMPVLFMYNEMDIYGVAKDLKWEPRADEIIYLAPIR